LPVPSLSVSKGYHQKGVPQKK